VSLRERKEIQEVLRNGREDLKASLLHLFYNGFYLAALLVGLPYVVFKMLTQARFRAGLDQRLGRIRKRGGDARCLWVHGVSVGELLAATRFVERFRRRHRDWEVVISTTTRAGYTVARRHYADLFVFYFPFDLSPVVSRVFQRIRPDLVILIELEIWPNFLLISRRFGVPVALLNGRISDRSFRGYRIWRPFLAEPIRQISLFCVQNKKYAARLCALGVPRRDVFVTGTMKYDTIVTEGAESLRLRMIEELRIAPESIVIIGGSTHPPEERFLLTAYRELAENHPNLVLILVPRRPERLDEVEGEIRSAGLRCVRKSGIPDRSTSLARNEVILVDTMGELSRIYGAADLVFVGGSLVPHGGQNMMEPAGLGKAVLFGPDVRNFQDSVDLLLDEEAAVMVNDPENLARAVRALLEDRSRMAAMGRRAHSLVRANQGASERSVEILRQRFPGLLVESRSSEEDA